MGALQCRCWWEGMGARTDVLCHTMLLMMRGCSDGGWQVLVWEGNQGLSRHSTVRSMCGTCTLLGGPDTHSS